MAGTSPVPQPRMAAPSPAQLPHPHRIGTMLVHAGSSALLLLVGTGTLAEAELVVLGAQGAGTCWTQGCPALARCPSGCVLRLPPPGKEQQPGGGQGPTMSLGWGVWGCPQRLWPCAGQGHPRGGQDPRVTGCPPPTAPSHRQLPARCTYGCIRSSSQSPEPQG